MAADGSPGACTGSSSTSTSESSKLRQATAAHAWRLGPAPLPRLGAATSKSSSESVGTATRPRAVLGALVPAAGAGLGASAGAGAVGACTHGTCCDTTCQLKLSRARLVMHSTDQHTCLSDHVSYNLRSTYNSTCQHNHLAMVRTIIYMQYAVHPAKPMTSAGNPQ